MVDAGVKNGVITAETARLEDTIQKEITQKNFVRAVMLAQKLDYPKSEIRYLQELALKQMACEYRNSIAVRNLAREWGFSRVDLENLLRAALDEYEKNADKKRREQCYDATSGKYLTLRQWIEQLLRVINR
jgi:hypothetical protein